MAPNNQILSVGDLIGSPFMNKPFELDLTNNNLTNVSYAIAHSICVIGVELNHKVKYPPLQFDLDFMAQLMKHPTENIIYNYRFGGNQWNCHCDSITDKQVLCNISTNLFFQLFLNLFCDGESFFHCYFTGLM